MGMTMTEKILAKHAGIDVVKPGQLINCKLDMVLANDVTAPPAIKEFEKIGKPVFKSSRNLSKSVKISQNFIKYKEPKWQECF